MAARRPIRKHLHKPKAKAKPKAASRARKSGARTAEPPGAGATQRLMTLLATLLDSRKPLSLEALREKMPGSYEGSDDAAERKFERDKDVLEELGIPLRYEPRDEEEEGGYLVDRDRLFLPDLELSPDESAALFLAGSALLEQQELPYRDDLERALEKIRLRGEPPAAQGAGDRVLFHYPALDGGAAIAKTLATIEDALERRKTLHFVYRSGGDLDGAQRKLDPYGLFCRRGRWLLVGWSHERTSTRVFTVQKIEKLSVNAVKPRSPDFEVPAGFRLRDYVEIPAWRYPRHGQITAEIEVDPGFAWLAEQELETKGLEAPGGEGAASPKGEQAGTRVDTIGKKVLFRVPATNLDALVEWLLGMGTKARVVAPEPLRKAVRERLDQALAVYQR